MGPHLRFLHLSFLFSLLSNHTIPANALPSAPSSQPQPPLPLPLLIWHGLGDTYDAEGISSVASLAQETNPGTYVYAIRLSNTTSSDRSATFFGNLTTQLDTVCDTLRTHPILSAAPAVNALGFSQGGQFLRAYVERCNDPPVRTLVTFGSQHNGIAQFQTCGATDWLCQGAMGLLRGNVWSDFVQAQLVPAQYYRDPEQLADYLDHSNFLADVNNEREAKNATYKRNLAALKTFAMYLFSEDKTVHPKETAWFAEVNGTTGKVTPLEERPIYTEDWLGLKELSERGGLDYRIAEGEHMQLDDDVLVNAFQTYFGPDADEGDAASRYGREDEL
ncbi:MAG: hypothetical protein M1833_000206 [Piccolia ochrophora]|nr:MAG: hypothetical protein M1833_000206 [Piccolia ochrophora]